MKHKIFACILSLVLVLGCLTGISPVKANTDTVDGAKSLINGILNIKKDEEADARVFLDSLVNEAGKGAEWYIFALEKYKPCLDYTAYYESLTNYIKETESKGTVLGATERERIALALVALGHKEHAFVSQTADTAIGAQGIMSYVFGLHLLNNGVESSAFTVEELVSTILSLRKDDGGWSIMGRYSDVDVTAMTLQALAPNIGMVSDTAGLSEAVSKALEFLSIKQTDEGGFCSYGAENAESSAQVLIALSSLGIDYRTDSRFIKNGHTVLDALSSFALEDGSFSHKLNEGTNGIATMQALCGLVASENEGPFFVYKEKSLPEVTPEITSEITPGVNQEITNNPSATEAVVSQIPSGTDTGAAGQPLYKIIATLVIAVLILMAALIQLLRKKKNFKDYLFILILGIAALAFVWLTNFEGRDSFYNKGNTKENVIGKVTISIRCDTIKDKESEFIPKDGVILKSTELEIEEGSTVYDILLEVTKKNRIQLIHKGSAETAYISCINQLSEFDYGDLSGWMYKVNGQTPSVGCGAYVLKPGDVVVWEYTCNLGKDLE